jgi:hypothetical protein
MVGNNEVIEHRNIKYRSRLYQFFGELFILLTGLQIPAGMIVA